MAGQSNRRAAGRGRPAAARARKRQQFGLPAILGGVVVIVAVLAAIVFASTRGDGEGGADSPLVRQIEASARVADSLEHQGFTLGSPSAPVELEVFEDFQCPFCIKFTANAEPVIVEEYVKTGKVRLTFRNFPILGAESVAAARASVCAADQGKAWPFILNLYALQARAGQTESERLNVGRFSRDALVKSGSELGLDTAAFSGCLDRGDGGAAVLEQAGRGTALGIKGTPGFAINGRLVSTPPPDGAGWRALLDAALAAPATTR